MLRSSEPASSQDCPPPLPKQVKQASLLLELRPDQAGPRHTPLSQPQSVSTAESPCVSTCECRSAVVTNCGQGENKTTTKLLSAPSRHFCLGSRITTQLKVQPPNPAPRCTRTALSPNSPARPLHGRPPPHTVRSRTQEAASRLDHDTDGGSQVPSSPPLHASQPKKSPRREDSVFTPKHIVKTHE